MTGPSNARGSRVPVCASCRNPRGNFQSFFRVGNCPELHAQYAAKHRRYEEAAMIRKLKSGGYRLYSRKINPKTGRRRNLGTFKTRAAAEKHEHAVQYFKRH